MKKSIQCWAYYFKKVISSRYFSQKGVSNCVNSHAHTLCLTHELLLTRSLFNLQGAATSVARDHSYYSNRLHVMVSNGDGVGTVETVISSITERSNIVSNAVYFDAVIPILQPLKHSHSLIFSI